VTAFDISEKGLEVARRNAAQAGVRVETVRSSAQDFDFGRERWDLIVVSYAPIPYEDGGLLKRIRESVKPGGLVLVDNPVLMHGPEAAMPRVPGDLKRGELPLLFPGFQILQYSEAEDTTEWFHMKVLMGRLLARKPG
jgi:predicted O-methyltransferase YrrM